MKMSKRSKIIELLEKITDIEKHCSVCYKQEIFVTGNNMKTNEELFITRELELNSDNEENIINKRPRPGQKKKEIIVDQQNFDRTVWEEISGSSKPGRIPVHNIFRNMSDYFIHSVIN